MDESFRGLVQGSRWAIFSKRQAFGALRRLEDASAAVRLLGLRFIFDVKAAYTSVRVEEELQ